MPSRMPRLATATLLAACHTMWLAGGLPAGLESHVQAAESRAGEEHDDLSFLRVTQDADGEPRSLDTAVVRYASDPKAASGLKVDLVAAVHIGSDQYYTTLNRLFRDYDVVLYELVAPENNRVPKAGQRPSGAIGSAQQGLTGALGLSFQLQAIDYSRANFVHADLSPQQFDEAMQKRGESWWTMFGRLMQEGMAQARRKAAAGDTSGEVGIGELFGLLFSSDREVQLRRIMAEQFTDMEVLTAAFGGENGSTIITDRNAAAIDVMRQQIAKGKERVAIFYGAAHMSDFDERLRNDFDLKPVETTWVEAWDLRSR
jgi:hypothetical protein